MHAIQGGLRRPKNYRYAAWCALAISALALAFPATSLAGQGGGELTTAAASGGQPRDVGLGTNVLALGSGYDSPNGSPLVRAAQRDLERAGYPPGGIDGRYGPRTRQAVIAFQTSHGLDVDGVVGPRTWAALEVPILILGPGAGDEPGGSNAVRSLQHRLAFAGDSPGPIDGRFGAVTAGAVRRFQRAHGLPVNGIADPRTLALLTRPAQPAHRPSAQLPQTTGTPPGSGTGSRPTGSGTAPATPPGSGTVLHNATRPSPRTVIRHAPRGSGRRPGSGATPWAIILGGLALAFALILAGLLRIAAVRRTRSRKGHRPYLALPPGNEANAAPPLELTDLAMANGDGRGATTINGTQVPAHETNGTQVPAHGTNGTQVPTHETNGTQVPARETNGTQIHAHENGARDDRDAAGEESPGPPSRTEPEDLPELDEAATVFNLGLSLEAQGSLPDAQAAYRRADELGHGTAASNLGVLLEEQGASAEAEAAYRRADQRGDGGGAFNLGALLEERNLLDEAAAAYRRALDRGHNAAASNLGVLLEEQGALDEAEAAYRRGDEHGDPAAAFNLAVLLEERGALTEAEEAYRRAEQCGDGEVADMARAARRALPSALQEPRVGRTWGADDA
jgi:peptidoglycan hydrolase-like protein with peptidoglycan-binding domain